MWSLIILIVLFGATLASPPLQLDISSRFEEDIFVGPSPSLFAGVRLSQDVEPLHYDLTIRPIVSLEADDPQQFTAPGEVTIRLKVNNPTDNITLHANDIDIDYNNVQVRIFQTSISIRVLSHLNSSAMSTYTTILEQALDSNFEYELIIPFVAKVGNRRSGLYRSSYVDVNGNQKWLATTQFQKLGARMAFPCFDEPNFKSTFSITIGRLLGYHSLTNAPLLSTTPHPILPNWVWDLHAPTVKMSSYLIAIIVSDFESVASPPGIANYDVKVWGPPTMTNNATAGFAATSAAQILSFFENYLQSPYQFPKLDSAAIPDFSPGAMENWALNTYRISYSLYFDGETTQTEKWGIARVFAHEISHHWFGDLVTCKWWNDLWLNEGFASYMEIIGGNATGFDIDAMERYPVDKIQVAMAFDAGSNTESVHHNDTSINNSQSSTIIYQKAASLIRMMTGFLTEKSFIGAIRNYLDKYEYSNTVQDDLFAELQSQADLDGNAPVGHTVKEIMDTWTLQTGFPIVSVTWFPDYVLFRHETFNATPPHWDDSATQAAGIWYTPIAWTKQSNPDFSEESSKPQFWFQPGQQNTSRVGLVEDDEWIFVNPDAKSYFRTIYCSHFISLIQTQLLTDHTVISANSRSQLIDDVFKTSLTNGWENAQITNALNVIRYLPNEESTAVWITALNNLRPINKFMVDSTFYNSFKTYLLTLITPALHRIGYEQNDTDRPTTIVLRSQLLDWACALGFPTCNVIAQSYAIGLATGTNVPADLQPVIFCKAVGISEILNLPGNFSIQDYLLQRYALETRAERFTVFINALGCASQNSVEEWLNLTTSGSSPFTTSHSISLLQKLSENIANRQLVVQYFTSNIVRIISSLGESSVSSVVTTIAGYTSASVASAELNTFINLALDTVTSESVRNSLQSSVTTMESNKLWMSDWGQTIEDYLSLSEF